MKITSKIFYRSFILSFAIFALVAAIILVSLYIDKTSVDPTKKESNVLVGVVNGGKIFSLCVVNCDPEDDTFTFLPIPDNTMIPENTSLQNMYYSGKLNDMINAIEDMIGARIDRHILFTVSSLTALTEKVGGFEYLIPYKFVHNDHENSGQTFMTSELTYAMFNYDGYDMTQVSLSDIGDSYLRSFLTKHGNSNALNKLLSAISDDKVTSGLITNISSDEMEEYCILISEYSNMIHNGLKIAGEYHTTNENIYFLPLDLKVDKNIFK